MTLQEIEVKELNVEGVNFGKMVILTNDGILSPIIKMYDKNQEETTNYKKAVVIVAQHPAGFFIVYNVTGIEQATMH